MKKKQSYLPTSATTAFLYRILIVYFIYFVVRFLFWAFNYDAFSQANFSELSVMFQGGIIFDTSAIVYTNILFILLSILPFKIRYHKNYQSILAFFFYVFNSIGIILNMGDIIYYRFTLRRTTVSVFEEFGNESNQIALFFQFMWDYWYITLTIVALILLMIYLYKRVKVERKPLVSNWVYYPVNTLIMCLFIIACIGGMRGGLSHSVRPITLSNASKYIDRPEHRALVLNTPFAIIRSFGKASLKEKTYFEESEASKYFNPIHHFNQDTTYTQNYNSEFNRLANRNIVILIWESGAREFTGFFNRKTPNYEGYTPFLDSLAQHSYTFDKAYANGRKSIDAMPSILTSIPRIGVCFVLSKYSGNYINSPASLLKEKGYRSAFTHGAPNGSMGFEAFVKQAGYQEYFGKDEYNNNADFDGMWGIWDEPFLQYTAQIQDTLTQPFITTTFTLSSHHPYKVPSKYEGKFPMGHIPYHQVIGYTDNALRKYFETARQMDWFNNTVFVITADHSTVHYQDSYKNVLGDYAVPMLIYAPNSSLLGHDTTTVVQQCDILPTLMNLVGYDHPFVSFGQNMLDKKTTHGAFFYANGTYQYVEGDYLLQFNGEKNIAFYNTKKDPQLNENILGKEMMIQSKMEKTLKAYLQNYLKATIHNELAIQKQ